MKRVTNLGLVSLVAVVAIPPALAQSTARGRSRNETTATESRSQAFSLHNPYTGGAVSVDLQTPARARPIACLVIVTGSNAREQRAAAAFKTFLVQRGYAVLTVPPIPASGAGEDDNLNTIAALHYLQTRPDFRRAPVGLAGYGEGVRLAAVSASQGSPASFLALLGGAVVPDRLNSLPDNLGHNTLPKDEAVRSLQHVRCPVLIMIGEYDRQGTHRTAAENSEALRVALDQGKHQNYTIKVLTDTDSLLADTGPGGANASVVALPPASVWATAAGWMNKQARDLDSVASSDYTEAEQKKPTRLYPKSVYGPFSLHPSNLWFPSVDGQPRPFGLWYW